jgi:hypothetical protein
VEGPERGGGQSGSSSSEDARALRGEPERPRQPVVEGRGRQRDGGGAIFDQGSHLFGAAEVGLADDAGLAVDAGAFDNVVVELVGFFLSDESGRIG